jgi:hypothetical protein
VTLLGAAPPEGAEVACRIAIREIGRYRVRVDAELIGPDGKVWVRINGWEDWRFYWAGRYRDLFRQPDTVMVSDPLPLAGVSESIAQNVIAGWIEPPGDMGRPVWRDVLEWVTLGPEERDTLRAQTTTDAEFSLALWERIAAKEAVRRLWLDQGETPIYPGDLTVEIDPEGRPRVRSLIEPERWDIPAVSFASQGGVAVAIASRDPDLVPGIAVQACGDDASDGVRPALADAERRLLETIAATGLDPREWEARLHSAKCAVASVIGLPPSSAAGALCVVAADVATGAIDVSLGPELAAKHPIWGHGVARVFSGRKGDYTWSWTIGNRR